MKIVFLTDLHIGNPKINLDHFLNSLRKFAYPEIATAQLVLLGGDFFDCLLNFNSEAGLKAIYIIDELIDLVTKNNIYLRVLRGTFSHDRYQNRLFVDRARDIPNYKDIPLIRTIDKIEVERLTPYDLDILYCPDDQPYKDVTGAVLEVLESNHLEAVDFFCCHGYWDPLVPPNVVSKPHNCLDYDKLKSKIRCYAFNGHLHSTCVLDKIISGGSFERFRHMEEEDKGFYTCDFDSKSHTAKIKFIRNQDAVPFITIDMELYKSTESVMKYLNNRIDHLLTTDPDTKQLLHVRLVGNDTSVSSAIKDKYPTVVLTEKHPTMQIEEDVEYLSDVIQDLPVITVNNLPDLIYGNTKDMYPDLTRDRIKEILDGPNKS